MGRCPVNYVRIDAQPVGFKRGSAMYRHVLFTLIFLSASIPQQPVSAEDACSFTNAQVYETLPSNGEKYGHPVEIAWSPDDRYLAAGTTQDDAVKTQKVNLFSVWDAQTWQPLLSFELPVPYYAHSISWSPDARHVAIFYRERLMVWNTAAWDYVEISVPEAAIYQMFWIDDTSLITLSDTGAWLSTAIKPYGNVSRLWDVDEGSLVRDFGVIGIQSRVVRVDGRWVIVRVDSDALRAYYEDDASHDLLRVEDAQLIDVNASTLQVAMASFEQEATTIQVWDLISGKALLSRTGEQYAGTGRFLADGFLSLNQHDSAGEVWEIEEQRQFPRLDIDRKDYKAIRVAWSLTTMCAAVSLFPSDDPAISSSVELYDMETRQHLASLEGHQAGFYVSRIAWSTSGQFLASSSTDDTIIIWQGQ
jgi:WD40 repeat protein